MAGIAAGIVAIAHLAVGIEQPPLEPAQQLPAQVVIETARAEGQRAFDDEGKGNDEQDNGSGVLQPEDRESIVEHGTDAAGRSGHRIALRVECLQQRQQHENAHALGQPRDHAEHENKIHAPAQIDLEDAQVVRDIAGGIFHGIRCRSENLWRGNILQIPGISVGNSFFKCNPRFPS